jgi:hypothetical protein
MVMLDGRYHMVAGIGFVDVTEAIEAKKTFKAFIDIHSGTLDMIEVENEQN